MKYYKVTILYIAKIATVNNQKYIDMNEIRKIPQPK